MTLYEVVVNQHGNCQTYWTLHDDANSLADYLVDSEESQSGATITIKQANLDSINRLYESNAVAQFDGVDELYAIFLQLLPLVLPAFATKHRREVFELMYCLPKPRVNLWTTIPQKTNNN